MRVVAVVAFACFSSFSTADKATIANGIAKLQEHLGELEMTSNTRAGGLAYGNKLYVEHLLKSMQELRPEDDPTLGDALDQVVVQFDAILASLLQDRADAQVIMDAFPDPVNACMIQATIDTLTGLANTAANAYTNLQTCMSEEHTDMGLDDTACGTLVSTLTTFHNNGVDCTPLSNYDLEENAGLFQLWDDWFTQTHSELTTRHNTVSTQGAACETTSLTRAAKVAECIGLQETHGNAVCAHYSSASTYCSDYNICYSGTSTDFNTFVGSYMAISAQRVVNAAMLSYLKCLVEQLRSQTDVTLESLESACTAVRNGDYTAYGNTAPTLPAADNCDADRVPSPIPGEAAFFTDLQTAFSALNILLKVPTACS